MKSLKGALKFIVAGLVSLFIVLKWDFFVENGEHLLEEWNKDSPQAQSEPASGSGGAESSETESKPYKPKHTPGDRGGAKKVDVDAIKVVSWNMCNIGLSKDNEEVTYMAKILKDYDILAIQEISTKLSGPRAITKLSEQLNRKGDTWDYVISDPTDGPGSERYAYLWRSSKLDLKNDWLVKSGTVATIDREPYMARFETPDKKTVLLANFHAVPSSKKPETEVELLPNLHRLYKKDNLMVMGDFNLSQKKPAFDGLKSAGYEPILVDQKTSLRRIPKDGDYLAQEYDNIFYETSALRSIKTGIIDFVPDFESLKEARDISDHLPIFGEFEWVGE